MFRKDAATLDCLTFRASVSPFRFSFYAQRRGPVLNCCADKIILPIVYGAMIHHHFIPKINAAGAAQGFFAGAWLNRGWRDRGGLARSYGAFKALKPKYKSSVGTRNFKKLSEDEEFIYL